MGPARYWLKGWITADQPPPAVMCFWGPMVDSIHCGHVSSTVLPAEMTNVWAVSAWVFIMASIWMSATASKPAMVDRPGHAAAWICCPWVIRDCPARFMVCSQQARPPIRPSALSKTLRVEPPPWAHTIRST